MRVGYACICLGREGLRCQRSTVLRNATPDRLRELIEANLAGLEEILAYNEQRDLRVFRLGNGFIPFASHPVNQLRWWEEFEGWFASIGRWLRQHRHRLSFHASHYTILNSVNPPVVESAIADIVYLGRVLEAMELGPEHKIILHVGINTPTFPEAEDRFERAVDRIPLEYRRHLTIENDDRLFPAERVSALARRMGLPMVVDVFHHQVLPGSWAEMPCAELLERAFATWAPQDGPPKIHFSSQDPAKRPGAHDYGVDPAELERFLSQSRSVTRNFDIMFECKGKDVAVEAVMGIVRADPRFEACGIPPGLQAEVTGRPAA